MPVTVDVQFGSSRFGECLICLGKDWIEKGCTREVVCKNCGAPAHSCRYEPPPTVITFNALPANVGTCLPEASSQ